MEQKNLFSKLGKENIGILIPGTSTLKNTPIKAKYNKNTSSLNIEELKKPCIEEKVFNVLKNNKHHISHFLACVPLWYKGYQGAKALYNSENLINAIDPQCKLNQNDPAYPMFAEILKSAGTTEQEIPIFKFPIYLSSAPESPGGACCDKAIGLFKGFDLLSSCEQQFIAAHELRHIANKDVKARTRAFFYIPLASYFALKGGSASITFIIDKLLARYKADEKNMHSYQFLEISKECINFIGENPCFHYLLSLYLLSKLSQHQETRADIEGALLVKSVEGGLSFLYNYAIGKHNTPSISFFTLFWQHPLLIFNSLLWLSKSSLMGGSHAQFYVVS